MSTKTPIPDEAVLAAIDRAECHRARAGVAVWLIFDHLGIPRRSRRVRTQLRALVQAGVVDQTRAHGVDVWTLTSAGRRVLRRVAPVELPESPQHRVWRNARVLAQQEVERFRVRVRDAVVEAGTLLDGEVSSDDWFELAERLRLRARALGSATYCLREWAEPSDDHADIDDRSDPADPALDPSVRRHREALRMGRRNTGLWAEDEFVGRYRGVGVTTNDETSGPGQAGSASAPGGRG